MPEYLKVEEAAEYLRLSAATLNKWRLTGDGPPFCRLGRAIAYRRADVDAWAQSRRVTSTAA